MVVHELRDRLRALNADIVFLQEVQGLHLGHAKRHPGWPDLPQYEFLAEDYWASHAYGQNVTYDDGHHGNALLSRYPILTQHNQDVTHFSFERRGLLYCAIQIPALTTPIHCISVHLSLFPGSRRRQLDALATRIMRVIPADEPLIIAGDFNDWRNHADELLGRRLGLQEAFAGDPGNASDRPARSFPALLPVLRLDRIYTRGFSAAACKVHHGKLWSAISDHAALSAELTKNDRKAPGAKQTPHYGISP